MKLDKNADRETRRALRQSLDILKPLAMNRRCSAGSIDRLIPDCDYYIDDGLYPSALGSLVEIVLELEEIGVVVDSAVRESLRKLAATLSEPEPFEILISSEHQIGMESLSLHEVLVQSRPDLVALSKSLSATEFAVALKRDKTTSLSALTMLRAFYGLSLQDAKAVWDHTADDTNSPDSKVEPGH